MSSPASCSSLAVFLLVVRFTSAADQSQAESARRWQQRAKAAIAAMEEQLVNERELAAGRLVDQMVKTGQVDDAVAVAKGMGISRLNVLLNIASQLVTARKRECWLTARAAAFAAALIMGATTGIENGYDST